MKVLNYLALLLVIIGAVNWGLIGLSDVNLVTLLLGAESMLTRIVYLLVGIAGIYMITFFSKISEER